MATPLIGWTAQTVHPASREVFILGSTLEDCALRHLNTGYPKIWDEYTRMLNARENYGTLAAKAFPIIRKELENEMRIRCPALLTVVTPDKNCYNLDLLFYKIVESSVWEHDAKFLNREMYQNNRGFELRVDQPFGIPIDNLLLRTQDKGDLEKLIDSIDAVLSDSVCLTYFADLSKSVKEAKYSLISFHRCLLDLIDRIKLKTPFLGECEGCSENGTSP